MSAIPQPQQLTRTQDEILDGLRRARLDIELAHAVYQHRMLEAHTEYGINKSAIGRALGITPQAVHGVIRRVTSK
jgi:hypothetical protein